jgi:DNA-binding transcriptional regulator YiaG
MGLDIPGMVKEIRRSLELTQEQLAHELGVTFSTVNAWENGRHRPIPALLAALRRLAAEPRARQAGPSPSTTTGELT